MKVLLTGTSGFVGARIKYNLKNKSGIDLIESPSLVNATEYKIATIFEQNCPDVVVHTAAISDICICEKNPDESYKANVLIPTYIAKNSSGAKLIMFSSDQVYSGCETYGPYSEEYVCPANTYAKHKLEMEKRVLDINENSVLLRATWMYDLPVQGTTNKGNFLINMLEASGKEQTLNFSKNQFRGITFAREVADNILSLVNIVGGVYNFGSENELSMFDTATFLKDKLNLKVKIDDCAGKHNLWMNCNKLKNQGVCFNNTINGLLQCIDYYKLK